MLKSKIKYTIIVFFSLISFYNTYSADNAKKPKILIFSSKGGGGHVTVSRALTGYLSPDYDVQTVNIFEEIIANLDPLNFLSFGRYNSEDLYNTCLQYRWTGFINKFTQIGGWGINKRAKKIDERVTDFCNKTNPDLIISVVPFINGAILNVAKKLNKPFLILTNDLDTTNYINAIDNPNYKKFYYTLAFNDDDMRKKIEAAHIPKDQVKITGFPLRPDFLKKEKNREQIIKDFNIPTNKKTVMLLMGGAGSLASYRYMLVLAKCNTPMHVVVCLGKNEKLRNRIKRIRLPKHITITIVGFTDRIADLMYVSDVLITKPGPGSICEAIASNLPMVIDQTGGILWWEVMNVDLVKKHAFGDIVTSFIDVNKVLSKYLTDNKFIKEIKDKMADFKNGNCFEKNIKNLVNEILAIK